LEVKILVVVLGGGVGASKFIQGLMEVIPQNEIKIIVNTGDDIELYGLHISPDLDIIMYTLAGIIDDVKGWGIKGDTFHFLKMLENYGEEIWFHTGDKDLATHLIRTKLMREGYTLTDVTRILKNRLHVSAEIFPMSDDPVSTYIILNNVKMHFEEYFVKYACPDGVSAVIFEGIEKAKPTEKVIEAIMSADKIILAPSNPVVSIGTILSLKGVKDALTKTEAKIVAVSPIINGKPVKGPADKLMKVLGLEVSSYGVAKFYSEFLDAIVIDYSDVQLKKKIESLDVKVFVTNTLMVNKVDKVNLSKFVLNCFEGL